MKTNYKQISRFSRRGLFKLGVLIPTALATASVAEASTDYGPAIWNPAYSGHWYTSGDGHKFVVIHDMEGYYLSCISYFQQSGTAVSSHYTTNGKQDTGTDHPAGEVTQMVRESHYAWHARCWNTHSFGTEHEGFVSNPAWFTYEQYLSSALLQAHLCDVWGITKDRNHIVGHNAKSSTAWVAWAPANLGIDPSCNTHSDPGANWNWTYFMALVNSTPYNNSSVVSISAPGTVTPGATFNATIVFRNISSLNTWSNSGANLYRLGSQNPQDNTRWGFSRVDMPVSQVTTGNTVTFTFTCTAPIAEAAYAFDWKMVQEGVGWFGPTASQTITVGTPPAEIIIDNPAATVAGTWTTGTSSADKYGSNYRYRGGLTGNYLQYTPNISTAGEWNVYEWHPQGGNRTTGAKIEVTHTGGTSVVTLNQQVNGGSWRLLGNYNFAIGSGGYVRITANHTDTANQVMADAIRFVYAPLGPPPTAPDAPSGLSATAVSTSQIDLIWTDESTNENNFIVARSSTAGGPYNDIATVGANVTTYSNTGLSSGTTYYYVVRAVNGAGASANSNEAVATTQTPQPPAAPSGLTATAVSTSQINLAWTDNSSDEDNFIVSRSSVTGGPYTDIVTLAANAISHNDTGLAASTTYYYVVRASNAGGSSAISNEASDTTQSPPTPPAAPSGLTATAVSSSQINLAWTDNSSDENNFIVARSTTVGGPYTDIATLAANAVSHNDTGLAASTTYYYVVRASNAGGASANSNEANATTQTSGTVAHVHSITMSWVQAGSKWKARAVVNVKDAGGANVASATVTGNFTGAINNSGLSGVSDASGNATITSNSSIKNGTVTFTVTNITGAGLTYNSGANVVTSASITR